MYHEAHAVRTLLNTLFSSSVKQRLRFSGLKQTELF